MTIRCAKCGTDNPARSASCRNCGKSFYYPGLSSSDVPKKIAIKRCRRCGGSGDPDDSFCPACGERYD
ncbi:MAG: zinc ribbon domain-containing protein [Thermoplasmata archaeon]|nr:zinc ribbon domain-containing protein [Thermoplasmata archaeon]